MVFQFVVEKSVVFGYLAVEDSFAVVQLGDETQGGSFHYHSCNEVGVFLHDVALWIVALVDVEVPLKLIPL